MVSIEVCCTGLTAAVQLDLWNECYFTKGSVEPRLLLDNCQRHLLITWSFSEHIGIHISDDTRAQVCSTDSIAAVQLMVSIECLAAGFWARVPGSELLGKSARQLE